MAFRYSMFRGGYFVGALQHIVRGRCQRRSMSCAPRVFAPGGTSSGDITGARHMHHDKERLVALGRVAAPIGPPWRHHSFRARKGRIAGRTAASTWHFCAAVFAGEFIARRAWACCEIAAGWQ